MPVPSSPPARRAPGPQRVPVPARHRASSSSAGPWVALLGLLTVAGSIVLGAWFMKIRPAHPAPEAASQETPPAAVAEPKHAVASLDPAQRAMAEAPLLTPESADALLTEMARRGQDSGHLLDTALFVANSGFADLDRATLGELGDHIARSWSARSAPERDRIQAYLRHARQGETLSPEAVDEGRALFAEGVRALPAASRERLMALFARTVAAGIANQQQAEERARVARLTPLPQTGTPSSALPETSSESVHARADASRWSGESEGDSVTVTTDGRRPRSKADESVPAGASDWDKLQAKSQRWRLEYRSAKANVDRLQAEVTKLEADAKNNLVVGYATEKAGGQVVCTKTPDPNSPYKSEAERIRERLPQARSDLANAKLALAAVEEAARKDGVASGQLY